MAKSAVEKPQDEEQVLIEKAKKLMEKARQIREGKILKAGKAAEEFHKSGFSDLDGFKKRLNEILGKPV